MPKYMDATIPAAGHNFAVIIALLLTNSL